MSKKIVKPNFDLDALADASSLTLWKFTEGKEDYSEYQHLYQKLKAITKYLSEDTKQKVIARCNDYQERLNHVRLSRDDRPRYQRRMEIPRTPDGCH